MVGFFNVQEHPKAQLAVVLILKRLRRRGRGLKSHPTDLDTCIVCGHVPWLYQYWPGGFMVLWVFLCTGAPEGSTGSGSGFKVSEKAGPVTDWESL